MDRAVPAQQRGVQPLLSPLVPAPGEPRLLPQNLDNKLASGEGGASPPGHVAKPVTWLRDLVAAAWVVGDGFSPVVGSTGSQAAQAQRFLSAPQLPGSVPPAPGSASVLSPLSCLGSRGAAWDVFLPQQRVSFVCLFFVFGDSGGSCGVGRKRIS